MPQVSTSELSAGPVPGASSSPSDLPPLDRATLIVAGVVIIGAVMSILDATVVNVALNTLGRELHSSLSTIQWVISGYTLALASVIPVSAWAADRFGAKQMWLGAVVVFAGGSLLCGIAWSAGSLIVFRVLQGIGGGVLTPVGTVIIARAAGPQRMGRVMALMGVPLLLGPVLGPVLGGVLLQSASWRWIFFINLPIGALALVLGTRLLPATPPQRGQRLDLMGLLLLSPGLAALIYGVSEVRSVSNLASGKVLIAVLGGVALIVAFVLRSLRQRTPLLDLGLFKGRTFAASSITTFALATAAFGSMLLLPLYFQQVRGEDVLLTGLLTTPQAAGMAVAMMLSGRVADRIGAGWVVPVGLALSVGALVGLTSLSATTSYWTIGALLVVLGAGLGSSMMPTMSAAYATLTQAAVARATSELQIVQRVGSTLGAALFAVVLQQRIVSHVGISGGLARLGHSGPAIAERLATAFAGTFWWAVVLMTVALIPALALPRRHRARRAAVQDASARGDCQPLAGNSNLATVEASAPSENRAPTSPRAPNGSRDPIRPLAGTAG
ncbi:MAG: multidrug efflux MFS transporter [Solirubrobacterales bacterium]|nr:multidrug efflux MFS transporter [Solirubrobacterales bacterium]